MERNMESNRISEWNVFYMALKCNVVWCKVVSCNALQCSVLPCSVTRCCFLQHDTIHFDLSLSGIWGAYIGGNRERIVAS